MEAVVPAFLLALASQIGERIATLVALRADRSGRAFAALAGALLPMLFCYALAAVAGAWIAPRLSPDAATLLLALALLSAGAGALWPAPPVAAPAAEDRRAFWPLLAASAMAAPGSAAAFLTFALAARSFPPLAAAGATLGSAATLLVATTLGRQWIRLPLRAVRLGVGLVLLLAGAWTGLSALHLA